jgi:drug/metabolite transporter (DMT)-like permease
MAGTNDNEPPQQGRLALEWLALVLIWSTTPLAVVLSLRDLDAVWALTVRMVLAALLALALLYATGQRLARGPVATRLYLIGTFNMFGAMLLTYLGARHLPSGLIAVLFGTSPLLVGAASHFLLKGVRLVALQWAGMMTGLAGLALIFIDGDRLGAVHLPSVVMVLGGVLCYVVSAVLMKRLPHDMSPMVQMTGALCLTALCCLLVAPLLGGPAPREWPGLVTVMAILYSVLMGSLVAMLFFYHLMQHVEAGTVALSTLVTPVIALLLGVLVNHERFQPHTLVGMGLILAGLIVYYEKEVRSLLGRRGGALAVWRR